MGSDQSVYESRGGSGDPETIAYITRRVSEGKTKREALRALKRRVTRRVYPILETTSHAL